MLVTLFAQLAPDSSCAPPRSTVRVPMLRRTKVTIVHNSSRADGQLSNFQGGIEQQLWKGENISKNYKTNLIIFGFAKPLLKFCLAADAFETLYVLTYRLKRTSCPLYVLAMPWVATTVFRTQNSFLILSDLSGCLINHQGFGIWDFLLLLSKLSAGFST